MLRLNATATGLGTGAYVQIGHSPFGAANNYSVTGDVTFPVNFSNGDVVINGGSAMNATAIIGHGNELSPDIGTISGNISVKATGDIDLTAGTAPKTHAIIGFHNPTGGSTGVVNSYEFNRIYCDFSVRRYQFYLPETLQMLTLAIIMVQMVWLPV